MPRGGTSRFFPRSAPILIGCLLASSGFAGDTSLTLGDLEGYRKALEAPRDQDARLVSFRHLWERSADYLGKSVRVEGQVQRQFRQGALGEFPPLVEAWIVSPAGDPICLVFPIRKDRPSPANGTRVRFEGTYLKRLRYQGGDVARVSPLIVGPEAPTIVKPSASESFGRSWSSTDWILGLGAASMVALVLARRHLSRPSAPPIAIDPPPVFADGESVLIEEDLEEGGAADDQSH